MRKGFISEVSLVVARCVTAWWGEVCLIDETKEMLLVFLLSSRFWSNLLLMSHRLCGGALAGCGGVRIGTIRYDMGINETKEIYFYFFCLLGTGLA